MNDNSGKYVVLDGIVGDASEAISVDASSGRTAYEVLRVIRGVPLFFEDHFERMIGTIATIGLSSAIKAGRSTDDDHPSTTDLSINSDRVKVAGQSTDESGIIDAGYLKGNIMKLLAANEADYCNVKIVINEADGRLRQMLYISKSHYPSQEEADTGVKTGLLQIERRNPNAKVINKVYIDAVTAKKKEDDYFELILVDNNGRITEGSKSNAFFVRDGSIFTAPGEFVLKGITRKYVFEACRRAGYTVIEQFVAAEDLPEVEAAFLSGTSIKVLPINRIDRLALNSSDNASIAAVRFEYDKLIEKYIDGNGK